MNGQRVFSIGGQRLATWSVSGARVSAEDAARFARFMRYEQGGHPQMLDILAREAVIPDQITLTMAGGRDARIVITNVRDAQPPPYDLTPCRREIGKAGMDALFDRIAAATPEQLDALRAAHPCDTADDFGLAQALDTMLGKMECMLSNGTPPSLTEEQKQAAGEATSLALLFAAVNPANPVLAGAYKDLGDLLLMQYDSVQAWRSWDAGRRLAPALSNFAPVNKFEADLLAQHPEFFLTRPPCPPPTRA
ncbi:hypothetical protein FHW58_002061 [Duganella sp. 1224]|uniref:hypothetical protein n=1 Tax=Duganella sp. 1224 TaxID=2587052 RepID=UPI0015CE932F|nr:hypothetical protein [Duganella sp. 1224]NYE60909.1 hypothetical protein [Duganella sp. 1224]